MGDPVEAAAIGAVFGRSADSKYPLYVGSVKSNIGHLEGASGVMAIIKAALMVEKGFLLPNCDFQHPNPVIPFERWNMKVCRKDKVSLLLVVHSHSVLGPHEADNVVSKENTSSIHQQLWIWWLQCSFHLGTSS